MAKTPKNQGKEWTNSTDKQLEKLADQKIPSRLIAWKMGRTEDAVRKAASDNDISLKPTNQSPYGTKK